MGKSRWVKGVPAAVPAPGIVGSAAFGADWPGCAGTAVEMVYCGLGTEVEYEDL